jgi:ribonucleoside-diphosphate reductase alpha chain
MKLTENAIKVLEKRYLTKDENGIVIETPSELFERVAKAVASADAQYDKNADINNTTREFYNAMMDLKFMPNSPTLMNAGKELGQLSACFVLPVEDSMDAIFTTLKNAALIHKSGGGTGFAFSRLRPEGAQVQSTGGVASGPISFMKVFNAATEAVKQGGTRRGANMGILRVDHPDIMAFIKCKESNTELTNFNISVAITEKFMDALHNRTSYDLILPRTKEIAGSLNAAEVFDLITKMSWKNGEPGIVYLDRINKDNPVPTQGDIESTNPCGEQPLLPYESCNLGSINLSQFVSNAKIDYEGLKTTVQTAVHFLDNVIDVNVYPLEMIEKTTKKTRKIGLGVMGFADMLYLLEIPYQSEQAVTTAEEVMAFIHKTAKQQSEDLGAKRGSFPLYDKSVYKKTAKPMRNATVTTIAPTGTISIICGASSGIEPVFALSYQRNVMDSKLLEVHPYFAQIAKLKGFYTDKLMQKIATKASIQHLREIPDDVKKVFLTAHDITPEYHVRIQAAFQKYTDNAVSKTVNFPKEATVEDVRSAFVFAYDQGCKGVTIYRDQSRDAQVLSVGEAAPKPHGIAPRQRPKTTFGLTEKVRIGCGNLYITVNFDENGLCEVFTNLGRAGGCPSQSEATSRLASLALRSGLDVKEIIEQLRGIRCHSTLKKDGLQVLSCPDAIGRVLEKALKMREKFMFDGNVLESEPVKFIVSEETALKKTENGECPECGGKLSQESGCVVCRECGFSKCG